MSLHAQNKSRLCELYSDKYSSNKIQDEMPKVYQYYDFHFEFSGISFREPEKLSLYIEIPSTLIKTKFDEETVLPIENYLLGYLANDINDLSKENININKDSREKAFFEAQITNELLIKRNGMLYHKEKDSFILKIKFVMPLIRSVSINAKNGFKAVKSILELIHLKMLRFNDDDCQLYVDTYIKQQKIRKYLKENNLTVFIADGSILPRENGTAKLKKDSVIFKTPETLRINIPLDEKTIISGMGIPKGITVITGGGYSGKSTLLDAIEMGIYNHIPGDGREFCISDNTALKIYAEDGRPIQNIDMSPFFRYIPYSGNITRFETHHASGSVSQAANIIEAVCGKSKLLLLDEDKTATNFMIHDVNMRRVVKQDPIIPFTDRIRELYNSLDISTILVIGGSSEYFNHADTVILMNDCMAYDITEEIKELDLHNSAKPEPPAKWMFHRYLKPRETNQPFLYFRFVSNENTKKIILDDLSSDITLLTSLVSKYQLNTLTYFMEQLLTDKNVDSKELIDVSSEISQTIYSLEIGDICLSYNYKMESWFEAVRPIDIYCCANRMRGLKFTIEGDSE